MDLYRVLCILGFRAFTDPGFSVKGLEVNCLRPYVIQFFVVLRCSSGLHFASFGLTNPKNPKP